MHTPVEEQGLRARRMNARVRTTLARLPNAGALLARVDQLARQRQVIYVREGGVIETVRILCAPLVVTPEQYAYTHATSLALLSACKRLPALYRADPDVKAALQLPPEEESWLLAGTRAGRKHDPVFARLDALVDYATPHWKDTLQFVEPNLSGIGGLHLLPASDRIIFEEVLPALECGIVWERTPDIRELLMQEIVDHLEAGGRPGRHVVFVEPGETTPGPDEQQELMRHFRARYGVDVSHADPRDLVLQGDEVMLRGKVVDLAYRDYAVTDLLPLRAQGVDIEPMRRLLIENRMISSITAEIDQKSCFEVFTDEALLDRHFTPDERDVLSRHVLWTRLVRERKTALWSSAGKPGRDVELLPFIRDHKDELVLKPNRSYGGYGVVVGSGTDDSTWSAAVDEAANNPGSFVVQKKSDVPIHDFPVAEVSEAGSDVHLEPFYTVMGFAPSRYGLATLGRASTKQVVNVAQRGGICPLVIGQPRS